MKNLRFIFIITSILLSTFACKTRDSELSADDTVGSVRDYTYYDITYYYALREPWLLRFKCLPGQTPPQCSGWDRANWNILLSQLEDFKNFPNYESTRQASEVQKKNLEKINAQLQRSTDENTKLRLTSQKRTAEDAISKFVPDKKLESFHDLVSQLHTSDLPISADSRISDLHSKYIPSSFIDVGTNHTCVIDATGLPICWGNNASEGGYDTHKDLNYSKPLTAISVGTAHTCALDANGEPVCWPGEKNPEINNYKKLKYQKPLLGLSTGSSHTCAIDSSQSILCWGIDIDKLLDGYKNFKKSFSAISAGRSHTCAIDSDHLLNCWGQTDRINSYKRPVQSLSHRSDDITGIGSDGELIPYNGFQKEFNNDLNLKKPFLGVAANNNILCAIDATGKPSCRSGSSPDGNYLEKKLKSYSGPVLAISAGAQHICVVDILGKVFCWGFYELSTGRNFNGYKIGLNVPEDVDLSLAAHGYTK